MNDRIVARKISEITQRLSDQLHPLHTRDITIACPKCGAPWRLGEDAIMFIFKARPDHIFAFRCKNCELVLRGIRKGAAMRLDGDYKLDIQLGESENEP